MVGVLLILLIFRYILALNLTFSKWYHKFCILVLLTKCVDFLENFQCYVDICLQHMVHDKIVNSDQTNKYIDLPMTDWD